jgi:hypothetical protein
MKHFTLLTFAVLLFTAACTPENEGPEIITDPIEKIASLSVVNVSGKTNLPTEIQIDGLAGKTSLGIGDNKQESKYENINAGVRNITLGGYQDTIHIAEHNYYTLMVYDNDSLQLSWDAAYDSSNQFVTMPQIRWNLIGTDPTNYKVNIHADSLLRDIPMNQFISVATGNEDVTLTLYKKGNPDKLVGERKVEIEANKKFTVNIHYNGGSDDYDFSTITQSVK